MRACLLSTTYFGPVQWYQKLHRYERVYIDTADVFMKQTYRNRCVIATTQGVQALTIPVTHDAGTRFTRDVRISDHGKWRQEHWNAIRTAYGESPFFEFYADDLAPFFERRWSYLVDFNEAIMLKMCDLVDISSTVLPLVEGEHGTAPDVVLEADDLREAIHPKHPLPDPTFVPKPYYQVFGQKHGFLPNLSILDLLMNEGNESIFYL